MTALFIIDIDKLPLDPYKTMAMALVHDILEVYAGDTPVLGSAHLLESKAEREAAALMKLHQHWPDMHLMHDLIEEYERRSIPEAIFIYALDKLVPILNNYTDNGRSWHASHVTFQKMLGAKTAKISTDPHIKQYYDQLVELLRQKPELFVNHAKMVV
jgi:putative hydrolase of HD superfamily